MTAIILNENVNIQKNSLVNLFNSLGSLVRIMNPHLNVH